MLKKIKNGLSFLKSNPRYFFFVAGLVYSALQYFGIKVNEDTFNAVCDFITVVAFGRVWHQSEKSKLL